MVFATPSVSDVINITEVHVFFDDVTRRAAVQFQYVASPIVTGIMPLSSFSRYAHFTDVDVDVCLFAHIQCTHFIVIIIIRGLSVT